MPKNPKPEEGDIVMVWWRDAYSEAPWTDIPVGLTLVKTVGFYNGFHEDDSGEYLSLYGSKDTKGGNISNVDAIPAGSIAKIRVLEKAAND